MPGTGEPLLPTGATESADGAVWITTRGHGVLRFANGRMEQFTERDGLSDAVANAVAVDAEGNAWIVTEAGLDRLRRAPFASLGRVQGLPVRLAAVDRPRCERSDLVGGIAGDAVCIGLTVGSCGTELGAGDRAVTARYGHDYAHAIDASSRRWRVDVRLPHQRDHSRRRHWDGPNGRHLQA